MKAWENGVTSGDYLSASAIGEGENAEYVDGTSTSSSALGRYVNHSLRRQNADLCSIKFGFSGVEFVQATKDVRAGQEFFIDYGPEYWDAKLGEGFSPQRLAVDLL